MVHSWGSDKIHTTMKAGKTHECNQLQNHMCSVFIMPQAKWAFLPFVPK